MKLLKTSHLHLILLVLILVLGFWLRLYRISVPIADWHSWKQTDTASVARNFYKEGFNPLLPKGHNMSVVSQPPKINDQRLNLVEFPIYQSVVYFGYLLNKGVDEEIARGVSILFSLGSIIFVYLIAKKFFDKWTGPISAALFAFLPYNIYFSRVTLPEPTLVFFSLGMFYFIWRWIAENKLYLYILSLLFLSLALLTKPYAFFYLPPLIYLSYLYDKSLKKVLFRFLKLLPGFIPLALWRIWILQFPEGIPYANWLFNENNIRYKPVFWKWILSERIGKEILTLPGTLFFFLGLVFKPHDKTGYTLHLLLVSLFIYMLILATGNVTHDYYQVLIVPVLAIFAARGIMLLIIGLPQLISKFITIPLVIFLTGLIFYLGWNEVKDFFQINNGTIVKAGDIANQILPKDAVIVAPYGGDVTFLYMANRNGFSNIDLPIQDFIDKYHVTHYLSTSKDKQTDWVTKKFVTLVDDPEFVIVDLTKKHPEADKHNKWDPKLLEINHIDENLQPLK